MNWIKEFSAKFKEVYLVQQKHEGGWIQWPKCHKNQNEDISPNAKAYNSLLIQARKTVLAWIHITICFLSDLVKSNCSSNKIVEY